MDRPQGLTRDCSAVHGRLETFVSGLDLASERGSKHGHLLLGLRTVGLEKRVTLAFVVDETRVTILRVFRGGQDWTATLADRTE